MREFFNKVTTFFLAGLCLAFLFSSCDSLFDVEVKEFFKEYTETAAIDSCEFNDSFLVNADGVKCFDSYDQKSVSFKLRNPQNYALKLSYEFNDSAAKTDNEANPYTLVLGASRDTATLTFSQAFLKARDCGTKNISGKVTIFEPNSGRYFESYPLSINADSAPPAVKNACFQLSAADNGTYIICFYLPDVNWGGVPDMSRHSSDTKKIYFNGELRYFKDGKIYYKYPVEGTFTTPDPAFEYSVPAGMTTSESGYDFTTTRCPAGYSAVYYKSGIPQSVNEVSMEIKIEDDKRLSSSIAVSNKAEELTSPYIANIDELAAGVTVDEESGLYDIVISHNGLTETGTSCGSVSINYYVYTLDDVLVDSGTAPSPAKISLPKDRYKISAAASRSYYLTSREYVSSEIYIKAPAVFYVSQNGSNTEGTGAKGAPYRSIQKAIDEFALGVTNGDYDASTECVIRVMSDLTPDESDTFGGEGQSLISLGKTNKYNIEGYNGKFTIDAQKKGRIIYSSGTSNIELKNLVLKGGSSSAQGAAIYTSATNLGALNIVSCTITENVGTGTNCIGGIIYTKELKLNNSIVSKNTLNKTIENSANGILLYASNNYSINNSVIENNEITLNGGTDRTAIGAIINNGNSYSPVISGSKIINNTINAAACTNLKIKGLVNYIDNYSSSLKIENSEISGNKTLLNNTETLFGTVFAGSSRQIIVLGKNTIYDNIYTVDGVDTQCNVYVTNEKPLIIGGDLSGKIGVTTSVAPEIGKTITFTKDYSNYSVSGAVFVSDSGYGIAKEGDEMAVAVGGGAIGDVLNNQTMSFYCSASKLCFYPGFEKTIAITPTLKLYGTTVVKTDDIWNNVIWTTWLTSGSAEVPETRQNGTGYTMTEVIPATVIYEDYYELHVKATLNGVSYDAHWSVKGQKDIANMSAAPTVAGTYCIASTAGLTKLKDWVNAGNVASTDFVFELTEDLNASTSRIGISDFPFKAVFDGKGHTFKGLSVLGNGSSALFTYIDSAVIKNLTIEGKVQGASYTAGIVGKATNSKILNCTNKAAITAYDSPYADRIAGICNTAENTLIEDCVNEGSVQSIRGAAAGILAQGSGTTIVKNCVNKGNVNSTATGGYGYVAGIVGEIVSSATVVIDGCKNEFNVESTNSYAAGIATGGSSSSIIRNCINTGAVTSGSSSTAGGIQPVQNANIYNCYNTGTIINSSGYAGGIVAKGSDSCVLSNCFSYAGISGGNVGNISGNNTKTAASINNYFIVKSGSSAQNGAGDSTTAPYTYKCTNNGSATTTASDLTVGAYTGKDVVQLLNAWIDSQENPSLYKRWKYDVSGSPVLED